MEKGEKYSITIGSPINYDELVAYINVGSKVIAVVSKDDGIENMKVELFDDTRSKEIEYDVLIDALRKAKEELMK